MALADSAYPASTVSPQLLTDFICNYSSFIFYSLQLFDAINDGISKVSTLSLYYRASTSLISSSFFPPHLPLSNPPLSN